MKFNRKQLLYKRILLQHDLPASISVFLVALPLCLGIALASNASLMSGILSGIVGGIVVSLISGSALGVSGPAAGLTTLVSAAILGMGDYRLFLASLLVAGLFQLLLGLLRLGSISSYFPSAVIKGMLAAIGIILISKQLPIALGFDQPDFWTSGFLSIFSSKHVLGNISALQHHFTMGAVIISLSCLLGYWVLSKPISTRLRVLPLPLWMVLIGVMVQLIFHPISVQHQLKATQLVQMPDNLMAAIQFPRFDGLMRLDVWRNGLLIGLLASLETLLCVEAIDKLDKHNRITPVNREMLAQGIGNVVCGLIGAIPMTAVVVRGAANVDAGARTRMSAFFHGVWLLMAVLLLTPALNQIPLAALAVVLVITGYKLARPRLFKQMWQLGWKQFLPFAITIVVILVTDLLIGVSIGLILSIYFIIHNNFKAEYQIRKTKQHETDVYYIKLNSNVTFLNKVKLRQALDQVPSYSILTIDGSESRFIDYDILEIISEFENKAHDRHIELHLSNIERVDVQAIH
jgi:MFS superfamily sulfate permease-like transporter